MGGRIWIGTSGFDYRDWQGILYPPGLPARERLAWYARHLDAVEVNATFYRLPRPATVRRWLEQVPDGFAFACKGPRALTHDRPLQPDPQVLAAFLAAVAPLRAAGRLAAVLWQLPPSLARDLPRLRAFADALPADLRHAFEFRHPSWADPEVYALFAERPHLAFVDADGPSVAPPRLPCGGFAYLRRHGTAGLGRGAYGPDRLRALADRLEALRAAGVDALVFFNNGVGGAAVEDARTLRTLLVSR